MHTFLEITIKDLKEPIPIFSIVSEITMRLSKLREKKMAPYMPSPLPALIPISSAFLLSLCILRELVQVFRVCFVLHSSREVSNKP